MCAIPPFVILTERRDIGKIAKLRTVCIGTRTKAINLHEHFYFGRESCFTGGAVQIDTSLALCGIIVEIQGQKRGSPAKM